MNAELFTQKHFLPFLTHGHQTSRSTRCFSVCNKSRYLEEPDRQVLLLQAAGPTSSGQTNTGAERQLKCHFPQDFCFWIVQTRQFSAKTGPQTGPIISWIVHCAFKYRFLHELTNQGGTLGEMKLFRYLQKPQLYRCIVHINPSFVDYQSCLLEPQAPFITNLHFFALDFHCPNTKVHPDGVLQVAREASQLEVPDHTGLPHVGVANQDDLEEEVKRVVLFGSRHVHDGCRSVVFVFL